jgi:DNA adenine methylase
MSLIDKLLDLERMDERREDCVRAPLSYPGGKQRSVPFILPLLPYRKSYIEPFGGAASILLARAESELEVYNDRYGGIVCFYRVLRDEESRSKLIEKLELSLHSREEFIFCRDTWDSANISEIERAFRWYYSTIYSFQSQGRNFGRSTSGSNILAIKLAKCIPMFDSVARRLQKVLIENLDWERCINDFDNPDAVFYLDAPYLIESSGTQYQELKRNQLLEMHKRILEVTFKTKGFVAVSSYPNALYDERPWDQRHDWEVLSTATQSATLINPENSRRGMVKECLYIKE